MTRLTEDEIDSLDTCACGHWAAEHMSDGCTIPVPEDEGGWWEEQYGAYLCPCLRDPVEVRIAAVEALIAARERAWREPAVLDAAEGATDA